MFAFMKVSVIIPTYNSEATIKKCLDSVLNQKGVSVSLDVIVVDNCSNDDTLSIVSSYDSVRWYMNSYNTGGPNYSRNRGLDLAVGDYICFLDSDDYWDEYKLAYQLREAKVHPDAIISCGVDNSSTTPPYTVLEANKVYLSKLNRSNRYPTYISTLMIPRHLKDVRFEENYGGMDYDYILNITRDRRVVYVGETLCFRRGATLSLNEQYRISSFYFSLYTLECERLKYGHDVSLGITRLYGSLGRYYMATNNYANARRWLKPTKRLKDLILYLVSLVPLLRGWFTRNVKLIG